MKNLIFVLSLVFSLSSFASISIVSDLDDTIKITQAGGNASDIIGDDVYTGMPEFFMGAKTYSNDLYVLSASPTFMRKLITATLKKRKVDHKKLILKASLREDKFVYKVREIKKIMDSSSDDFIFLGDDLGKDPEVYAEITKQYPSRVLASYIHVVNGRPLVQEVVPYYTSFDLFLRELIENRMTPGWVEQGWQKLLLETKYEFIFPRKAECPTEATVWEWQTQTAYQPEAVQLISRLTAICQARQSDNILL